MSTQNIKMYINNIIKNIGKNYIIYCETIICYVIFKKVERKKEEKL